MIFVVVNNRPSYVSFSSPNLYLMESPICWTVVVVGYAADGVWLKNRIAFIIWTLY